MPQLGETVTEGTITKWYKAVGDQVARDEPLFEVSTDKVDSEVPSPAEGVVTAILVEEGDTVDVGAVLAVIGDSVGSNGTGPAGVDGPAESVGGTHAPAGVDGPAGSVGGTHAPAGVDGPAGSVGDVTPDRPGPETGVGVPVQPDAGDAPAAAPAPATVPAPRSPLNGSGEGLVLSPVVRRLLTEHDIEPAAVKGTGLGGRITRSDVEAVVARGGDALADASAAPARVPSIVDDASPTSATVAPNPAVPAPAAPAAPRSLAPAASTAASQAAPESLARDEIIPFTNIRRRTAEHMVRSKATSAHTLMVKEVDYERVEQVRRAHGERFRAEEGFSLTYLAFAARAAVDALADFPHLNASVGDDSLIVHHHVNLGFAVDLDNEGLIVPVVHDAEELNLRGMARRIRDVAERARSKRLSLDDISDGTFSITNAGPFGTLLTGAIINQPQVAILSTDGVARKPVVVELPDGTESITIHSVGLAAMTFDHRAVDGAYVARFLARLSEILNDRDWAGEL
jgi:pyruvate dehydrogenase E2 component (dihydrolipoamide acetyltransferase)